MRLNDAPRLANSAHYLRPISHLMDTLPGAHLRHGHIMCQSGVLGEAVLTTRLRRIRRIGRFSHIQNAVGSGLLIGIVINNPAADGLDCAAPSHSIVLSQARMGITYRTFDAFGTQRSQAQRRNQCRQRKDVSSEVVGHLDF